MDIKYVVEIIDEDECIYERYNGSDINEAKRIYNEFAERNKIDVCLYKKEILAFNKANTEDKLQESCSECEHYSTRQYRCHNEVGLESCCAKGYMKGHDMRDQNIWLKHERFKDCGLQ